ncbi:MAG: P1 family peptidase [Candidatus Heimdallarchaeota archaeon]|nr:MAG: P1 family peptidase [Candidatus Heimdallarchaeota archaeon]
MRARNLGIPFDGEPGKNNAITDVEGVEVGHSTIISGDGSLVVGKGPIRTGVTAIFPSAKSLEEVYSAYYSYNGNGEMTGTIWIEEAGRLKGPLCLTNTHSVGIVRDAIIEWSLQKNLQKSTFFWRLPVVAETYDGLLNDINGFHVKREHVFEALESAKGGPVKEGNNGGGTGMVCHQFKGGIGTSSRVLSKLGTIGVLVQANYGARSHLTIAGVPVGENIPTMMPEIHLKQKNQRSMETGSIIVIVATDIPLLPYQLKRLAKRVPAGLARVGGYGGHSSGDIFLAFSTANKFKDSTIRNISVETLNDSHISSLFKATAEATEEAIINALISAKTMKGINDNVVFALPYDELKSILRDYNRLVT